MDAKKFREMRIQSGLTVKEACYYSGYCTSSWRNFETGFREPSSQAVAWLRLYCSYQNLLKFLQVRSDVRKQFEEFLGYQGQKLDFYH